MKNLLSKALAVAATAFIIVSCTHGIGFKKDVYTSIVRLSGAHGMCSGEAVTGKSGTAYILTAAHCQVLSDDGQSIKVTTADGRELSRRIIQVDDHADLMLLEGAPSVEPLTIASQAYSRDKIETYTRGNDFPTYQTEGVLIGNVDVKFVLDVIDSPEAEAKCKGGSMAVENVATIFGDIPVCMFSAIETATTALIVPGSSGGAVVNADHELVGVVSAGSEKFGYMVRLQDIKNFLNNY